MTYLLWDRDRYLMAREQTITRFDVRADDTLINGKLIIDMGEGEEPCAFPCLAGCPDGMKVDQKGDICSTSNFRATG